MPWHVLILYILLLPARKADTQQDSVWTLEECINFALEKNIQVRMGELTNQRYQYYAVQASTQRFPSVNASAGQNWNWSKGVTVSESGYVGVNGSNVNINAGVTLYNASRRTNQIMQADTDIKGGKEAI